MLWLQNRLYPVKTVPASFDKIWRSFPSAQDGDDLVLYARHSRIKDSLRFGAQAVHRIPYENIFVKVRPRPVDCVIFLPAKYESVRGYSFRMAQKEFIEGAFGRIEGNDCIALIRNDYPSVKKFHRRDGLPYREYQLPDLLGVNAQEFHLPDKLPHPGYDRQNPLV